MVMSVGAFASSTVPNFTDFSFDLSASEAVSLGRVTGMLGVTGVVAESVPPPACFSSAFVSALSLALVAFAGDDPAGVDDCDATVAGCGCGGGGFSSLLSVDVSDVLRSLPLRVLRGDLR